MTKELVFIPIARDELAAIDGSVQLTGRAAHRVTPELLAALGYTAGQEEDAEYAALVLVSVAVLTRFMTERGRALALTRRVRRRTPPSPAVGPYASPRAPPPTRTPRR